MQPGSLTRCAMIGAAKVDRLVLKTMGDESPEAQVSGGEAAKFNALRTTRSTFVQYQEGRGELSYAVAVTR